MISQQPFQKVAKAERNLYIKIQQPFSTNNLQKRNRINTDNHKVDKIDVLKSQIREAKDRIAQSKLALMLSRKQQSSPNKLVSSDHIGIVFDHEGSKKNIEKFKMNLSKVYERDDETERQQQGQGDIQLPLHFTNSFEEKSFNSIKNGIESFQTSHFQTPQKQRWNSSRPQGNNCTDRKIKIQPLKRELFKLDDYKPKELIKQSTRERNINLLRQRQLQKLNRSLQNPTNNANSLEKYLLNKSLQRLPQYQNHERRSTSKGKIKPPFKKQQQKIKIKLNKPSCGKSTSGKQLLRPRYQFEIPAIKVEQSQRENHMKQLLLDQKNDWDQLKKQVTKYEFVRKYLTEADIFAIYQHLKKNKIKQQKWPLFVVDQASKKMKVNSFK